MENQILQCYQNLSNQNGQGVTPELTEFLESVYRNVNSFPSLLLILNSNVEENILEHCLLGIKSWLNHNWNALENKAEIIDSLFKSLSSLHSLMLLKTMALILTEYYCEATFAEIIQFSTHVLNNQIVSLVPSAIQIFDSLCELISIDGNISNMFMQLIQIGIQGSEDSQITTIQFVFHLSSLYCEDPSNPFHIGDIFVHSLNLLLTLNNQTLIKNLLKIYSDSINTNCLIINPFELLQRIIVVIDNFKQSFYILDECFNIIESIMEIYPDIFSNEALLISIHQFSFYLTQSKYNTDDEYEISPSNYPQIIGEHFAPYSNLVGNIISKIKEFQQSESGMFYISLFLKGCIETEPDFYSNIYGDVVDMFCKTLLCQSNCLREAICESLSTIVEMIGNEQQLLEMIQNYSLQSLIQFPSTKTLNLIQTTLTFLENSDEIIDTKLPIFLQILNCTNTSIQISILQFISTLIKNCRNEIVNNFNILYSTMTTILQSTNNSILCGNAIYCLAHLSEKSVEQFSQYAFSFAEFLTRGMQNEDTYIAIEMINAYGFLVDFHTSSTLQTITLVIQILTNICQNPPPNSEIISTATISDISLRVLCAIASKFPDYLQQNYSTIINFIKSNNSLHSAKGACIITESLNDYIQNIEKIVNMLIPILLNMINTNEDAETISISFEAIYNIISNVNINFIIEHINNILITTENAIKCNLHYHSISYSSQNDSNLTIQESASKIFGGIISTLKENSINIINQYFPLFVELCNHNDPNISNIGVKILVQIIQEIPINIIQDKILGIFEIAQNLINQYNYMGVYLLKNISIFASQLINPNSNEIINGLKQKFIMSPNNENDVLFNENLISAIGAIITQNDKFVVDESIVPFLQLMPPIYDADEFEDIMKFFEWLLKRANGNFLDQFAAVLIRMFGNPLEFFRDREIDDKTLGEYRNQMIELIKITNVNVQMILGNDPEKLRIFQSYL